jgi:hypothetical protein
MNINEQISVGIDSNKELIGVQPPSDVDAQILELLDRYALLRVGSFGIGLFGHSRVDHFLPCLFYHVGEFLFF